jgi:hypothetical protein
MEEVKGSNPLCSTKIMTNPYEFSKSRDDEVALPADEILRRALDATRNCAIPRSPEAPASPDYRYQFLIDHVVRPDEVWELGRSEEPRPETIDPITAEQLRVWERRESGHFRFRNYHGRRRS